MHKGFPINRIEYDQRLSGSSRLIYGLGDPEKYDSLHFGADDRNHRVRLTEGTLGATYNQDEGVVQKLKALIQTPGYELFGLIEVVKKERPALLQRGYIISRLPYGDNSRDRATLVDELLPGQPTLLVPSEASQTFHPDWTQWGAAVDISTGGRIGIELRGEGGVRIITPQDTVHQEIPHELWAPRSAVTRTVMEAGRHAMAGAHAA